MKINENYPCEKSKDYLCRAGESEGVNHHRLCFDRDSKAGGGVGKLDSGRGKVSGVP